MNVNVLESKKKSFIGRWRLERPGTSVNWSMRELVAAAELSRRQEGNVATRLRVVGSRCPVPLLAPSSSSHMPDLFCSCFTCIVLSELFLNFISAFFLCAFLRKMSELKGNGIL